MSVLVTVVWQSSRNSLAENGDWVSSKMLMHLPPMGAAHFLVERQAVRRDRLNPSAWHGYQEVHLNRVFSPGLIRANFRLLGDAYLYVIFNRDENGFDGVRLSRDPDFPSMFFRADRRGEFQRRTPIDDRELTPDWHSVEIDFTGGPLAVRVDDRDLQVPPVAARERQFIGFRSGFPATAVDDVEVFDANGLPVIRESFRNVHGQGRTAAVATSAIAAFVVLFVLAGRIRGKVFESMIACLVAILTLAVVSASYYAFDSFFWTSKYDYYVGFTPNGRFGSSFLSAFEAGRSKFFGTYLDERATWKRANGLKADPFIARAVTAFDPNEPRKRRGVVRRGVGGRAEAELLSAEDVSELPAKQDGGFRLAFVGTSQTFGEGAEVGGDRFVDRIHRALAGGWAGAADFETFNFSIQGSNSSELLNEYESHWSGVAPDLMVINLSYNDIDPDELAANLREFIRMNRLAGTETLLVTEPAAHEKLRRGERLEAKRDSVRAVAAEFGVPLADMSAYFEREDVYASGLLWWDFVHMTSLGQELAAAFLLDSIRPLVPGGETAVQPVALVR